MSLDLISVIIPVYKVEQYLDKCISSVVGQTYKNLEIILVDDGSPDDCPRICDEWAKKDARVKVIHKANGGLSDARNAGMAIASGELIGFVDSDDWIKAEYFDLLYRAIQETDSDISVCGINRTRIEAEADIDNINADFEIFTPKEAISDIINDRKLKVVVWNKLYKRELLKNEFFPVGRYHEDEFFTYRIIDKAEKIVYTPFPLYNYRQREGSIMTSVSLHRLDVLDAYIERIKLFEKKYPELLIRDKINFCTACRTLYYDFSSSESNGKTARDHIKARRKYVCVSVAEFFECSAKEKLYVLLSRSEMLGISAKIRQWRHRNIE